MALPTKTLPKKELPTKKLPSKPTLPTRITLTPTTTSQPTTIIETIRQTYPDQEIIETEQGYIVKAKPVRYWITKKGEEKTWGYYTPGERSLSIINSPGTTVN